MTNLPAAVWNQIAETQELQTPAAKVAFRLNPDQLAKLDDLWANAERAARTPSRVVRCLPMCLPLLTESEAINQFVSQHPESRNALPEINSPEEAADLMEMEGHLTPGEKATLQRVLSSPETEDRWLAAGICTPLPGASCLSELLSPSLVTQHYRKE